MHAVVRLTGVLEQQAQHHHVVTISVKRTTERRCRKLPELC